MAEFHERIAGPDELRGFALFGICVVNLPLLARSWQSFLSPPQGDLARAGIFINSLFFEAKFFGLFSFLFGLGIFLILQSGGVRVLLRRLLGLMVLGVLHALLLFPGDILASYALLGLLLLLLRNKSARTLLIIAFFCFLLSYATFYALGLFSQMAPEFPKTNYLSGYADAVRSNAAVYRVSFAYVMLFNWPLAFAMFCLGYLTGRGNLLGKIRWSRWSPLIALAGLAGSFFYAFAATYHLKHWMHWAMLLLAMTSPLLSLSYAQALFTLIDKKPNRLPLRLLAAAGRLSLTNYIMQSLIAGILFHGYGFRLYDRFSYGGLLLFSAAIFAFQLLFSVLWLRFFQCGPEEWLLRSFSRWQLLPFRR